VAHEISKELPIKYGATLNVVYFPQLGYLVTLPRSNSENTEIEGFELQVKIVFYI
jgi:DNA mismatch repair protein MSH5